MSIQERLSLRTALITISGTKGKRHSYVEVSVRWEKLPFNVHEGAMVLTNHDEIRRFLTQEAWRVAKLLAGQYFYPAVKPLGIADGPVAMPNGKTQRIAGFIIALQDCDPGDLEAAMEHIATAS